MATVRPTNAGTFRAKIGPFKTALKSCVEQNFLQLPVLFAFMLRVLFSLSFTRLTCVILTQTKSDYLVN
jgi:hypothetical protein